MHLGADEFVRRFLLHVLPDGFHKIRHYGLLANAVRVENIAKARALLNLAPTASTLDAAAREEPEPEAPAPCPCCGGRMVLIDTFERSAATKFWTRPSAAPGYDTS